MTERSETSEEELWPREIWMAEREEYDQGQVSAVLSEWATVSRWDGDKERDREFHRYVDGDILDSADKYWRARVDALENEISRLKAVSTAPPLEPEAEVIIDRFDKLDGRVVQTVRKEDGAVITRICSQVEAYGFGADPEANNEVRERVGAAIENAFAAAVAMGAVRGLSQLSADGRSLLVNAALRAIPRPAGQGEG